MPDNIEILTFTGVDSQTDLGRLIAIQQQYPKVEFGVLIGSRTDEFDDHGIFPNKTVVRTFRDHCINAGTKAAVHLCGNWSRAVVKGMSHFRGIPWQMLIGMSRNFQRVQINQPSSANMSGNSQQIIDFTEEVVNGTDERAEKVILQHRETFESVPILHDSIEYLFDKSGGAGTQSFSQWPFPSALRRSGYAGGLGPDNIHRALTFAEKHSDFPMWFDMESGVRKDGWFDLDAVEDVCRQVFSEE